VVHRLNIKNDRKDPLLVCWGTLTCLNRDIPLWTSADKLNGPVTDDVNCLIIIIAKDDNNINAVHFEINLFDFYH